MVLTGSFARTLDEKLRVAIPKELRDAANLSPGGVVYAAPGTDGSLALYPEHSFSQLAERLSAGSPTAPESRDFSRLFFAAARRLEVDGQGRVRIPAELAARAGLTKEAVLVGVRQHMELWNHEQWAAYVKEKTPQYDTLAAAAFRNP
jgi:MraZ protein